MNYKRVPSPLPIDLLNLVGSFVPAFVEGNYYYDFYWTFQLTPKGFISHHRMWFNSYLLLKKHSTR